MVQTSCATVAGGGLQDETPLSGLAMLFLSTRMETRYRKTCTGVPLMKRMDYVCQQKVNIILGRTQSFV